MANVNSNGNAGGLPGPEDVLCESIQTIRDERNAATGRKNGSKTRWDSKIDSRRYKICCLDKAQKIHTLYLDLDNCIALETAKGSEIIQKNIDAYIKKDADLGKMIKETSKIIGDLKKKLEEAHKSACAMKICINNRIDPDNKNPTTETTTIKQEADTIESLASELDTAGQTAFDDIVTISGIQTFLNLAGLKPFGQSLVDTSKAFKAQVDANIKSTADDVKNTQAELTKVLEELTQARFAYYSEKVAETGLETTRKDICEGGCDSTVSVETYCLKISRGPGARPTALKSSKSSRDRN